MSDPTFPRTYSEDEYEYMRGYYKQTIRDLEHRLDTVRTVLEDSDRRYMQLVTAVANRVAFMPPNPLIVVKEPPNV